LCFGTPFCLEQQVGTQGHLSDGNDTKAQTPAKQTSSTARSETAKNSPLGELGVAIKVAIS